MLSLSSGGNSGKLSSNALGKSNVDKTIDIKIAFLAGYRINDHSMKIGQLKKTKYANALGINKHYLCWDDYSKTYLISDVFWRYY